MISEDKNVLKKIGFIVNPIAGMGGRVGLKGTDGEAYREALRRGAKPVAPERANRFLRELVRLGLHKEIELYSAPSIMGADYLKQQGIEARVVGRLEHRETTAEDTKRITRELMDKVDLIVFVGGDGTARDIIEVVGRKKPILGVPSGVKVYSSVFATTPEKAAQVLEYYAKDLAETDVGEVLDIDEEAFRSDTLVIKHFGEALTIRVPGLVQGSKEPTILDETELENQRAIARYIIENMEENTLYILGPGTTLKTLADELGVPKTVLGVDAVYNKKLIGKDLNEQQLLSLLDRYRRAKIIVTPIGGQGFIFGRGNQQISPNVIRRVGKKNIVVIATRRKISRLKTLRIDTGDPRVDAMLRGYIRVVVDYNEELVVKVE